MLIGSCFYYVCRNVEPLQAPDLCHGQKIQPHSQFWSVMSYIYGNVHVYVFCTHHVICPSRPRRPSPAFRTASDKSWAWRPGNEARGSYVRQYFCVTDFRCRSLTLVAIVLLVSFPDPFPKGVWERDYHSIWVLLLQSSAIILQRPAHAFIAYWSVN